MRRTSVLAPVIALGLVASAGAATAAPGDLGTGTVVDVVGVTATAGGLVLAGVGTGLAAGLSNITASVPAGGGFGSPVGGSVLAVTDARLSTDGWYVTATYSDGVLGTGVLGLGKDNIKVRSHGLTGSVTGAALTDGLTGADEGGFVALSSPVTVASTGNASGAGITQFNTQYKVQIPVDAAGTAFSGTVTYTVASVR